MIDKKLDNELENKSLDNPVQVSYIRSEFENEI